MRRVLKQYCPYIYDLGRVVYWKLSATRAWIAGTRRHERFWERKHLKEDSDWDDNLETHRTNNWTKGYMESRKHEHRGLLLEKISKYYPCKKILEIGCNCGPNLYMLAKRWPTVELKGIDINPIAVKVGNEFFAKEGLSNVKISEGKADKLATYPDKSFDIVFTDAVLIYIGPDKIRQVINEMTRIARKALIFVEWHVSDNNKDKNGTGMFHHGLWKRNYTNLFKTSPLVLKAIHITKIPEELWPADEWRDLGYIVEIVL